MLFPGGRIAPPLSLPFGAAAAVADRDDARARLLRGHCEVLGPVTAAALAGRCGLRAEDVERGLVQVEAAGHVLRGRFTPSGVAAGPLPTPGAPRHAPRRPG